MAILVLADDITGAVGEQNVAADPLKANFIRFSYHVAIPANCEL